MRANNRGGIENGVNGENRANNNKFALGVFPDEGRQRGLCKKWISQRGMGGYSSAAREVWFQTHRLSRRIGKLFVPEDGLLETSRDHVRSGTSRSQHSGNGKKQMIVGATDHHPLTIATIAPLILRAPLTCQEGSLLEIYLHTIYSRL